MMKGTARRAWLVQAAVAIGYAIAYIAVRPASDAHWALTSGLRLICLLVVPYRFWVALAIGEICPLVYFVAKCIALYGITTAAIFSFPPIIYAMPIVWVCRRYFRLYPAPGIINVHTLVVCVLSTSLVWALITYVAFLFVKLPSGYVEPFTPVMILGMFVGNYVAALTIITWPLLFTLAHNKHSFKALFSSLVASPLAFDAAIIALPSLLVLAFLSNAANASSQLILQMCLFLPVGWLTLKYGWRGAAALGPIAVACICLLTRSTPDLAVIQTQSFVALTVSFLFATGARIASQMHVEDREREAARNALRIAQQSLYQNELRMRSTAHNLQVIGGAVSIAQSRVLDRARSVLSIEECQYLTRQAATTQAQLFSLAESIHPIAWRERGLPAALRETIGHALDEANISYACDVQGRGLALLAPAVHQALYRLACEAVAHVCSQLTCNRVSLTLRGGQTHLGQRWAVLQVVGIDGKLDVGNLVYRTHERNSIGTRLGTLDTDVESMREQVSLFGGLIHTKTKGDSLIFSMLLHDVEHLDYGKSMPANSERMWVR